jgi:Flp pilus assembly protein TadB
MLVGPRWASVRSVGLSVRVRAAAGAVEARAVRGVRRPAFALALAILAAGLIVAGVAAIYWPAGLIVAGLLLFAGLFGPNVE